MNHSDEANTLPLPKEFATILGYFHAAFASLDLTTDFAIFKFLNTTPAEAHLITSGMTFGRKARLLADLTGRSDHPNKKAILSAFNAIRGNKRYAIAHGYLWTDQTSIKFIERNISGEFKTKEHSFTPKQFFDYVLDFSEKSTEFYNSLGTSRAEINEFAKAAFSLNRRSTTSPGRPTRRR
jgi:hypothetical protein